MFSSSSSQTGGIIFFADKIYFRNIFSSLFVIKNKKKKLYLKNGQTRINGDAKRGGYKKPV